MSRKTKIKAEEKIRVAKACSKGRISICAAAEQQGVHPGVVNDWVRQYETEEVSVFLPQRENRRYDPILKEAAVKDYLSCKGSLRDICRKYKIRDKKELRTWIKVYNGHKDFKKQTGGSHMTKGRETTQAERIAVAKACIANGKNYGEVAIAYNATWACRHRWRSTTAILWRHKKTSGNPKPGHRKLENFYFISLSA